MGGGVLFRVCIPTSQHEWQIRENLRSKTISRGSSFVADMDHISKLEEDVNSVPSVEVDDVFEVSRLVPDRALPIRSKLKNELSSFSAQIRKNTPKSKPSTSQHHTKYPVGLEALPMEKALKKILQNMNVINAVWCLGEDRNYYQIQFSMEAGEVCEEILRQLTECGIGLKLHSVISMTPCALYYQGVKLGGATDEEVPEVEQEKNIKKETESSEWTNFLSSVRAHLTVAQVVQGVKADASLTFDFLVLLLIAAFLAALGLVENSTEILVGSMLISPLMGPVMAGTFGTMIGDKKLQKIGIRNELLGLLICLIIGYMFGFSIGVTTDQWGDNEWPTGQMTSRGRVHSVWVGILIALFSGAAVAIATLGDYTGSLVGVAISTAVLPPAVNAGLLWSLACTDLMRDLSSSKNSTALYLENYVYSEYQPTDLAIQGAVSVCLTLVNIVCIFLAGILVLKIKAVAPRTSKQQHHFWSYDVKVARDYNQTLDGKDAVELGRRLASELSAYSADEYPNKYCRKRVSNLMQHSDEMFKTPCLGTTGISQLTWSPGFRDFLPKNRPSVKDLELLYMTLAISKNQLHTNPQIHNVYEDWLPGTSGYTSNHNFLSPLEDDKVHNPGLATIPETQTSYGQSSVSNLDTPNRSARFVVTPAVDPINKLS